MMISQPDLHLPSRWERVKDRIRLGPRYWLWWQRRYWVYWRTTNTIHINSGRYSPSSRYPDVVVILNHEYMHCLLDQLFNKKTSYRWNIIDYCEPVPMHISSWSDDP